MKRIRVYHKRLGELLGYEMRRVGGVVVVKLDAFEREAEVQARYVSEADDVEQSADSYLRTQG